MARRATLIDSLRAEVGDLLLLDSGDFGDPRSVAGAMKSRFVYRMMGRLGYDAVTVGPRDVRYLGDAFPSEDGPPVILTNAYDTRQDPPVAVADRWKIFDVDGIKIGVFALLSPNLTPNDRTNVSWLEIRDPESAIADAMAHFDARGVAISVLLSQLEKSLIDSVLVRHPEVDVAVLGHISTRYRGANYVPPYNTFTMRSGIRGHSLSHATLVTDPDGDVFHQTVEFIEVTKERTPDPDVLAVVEAFQVEVEEAKRLDREARQQELADNRMPHTYLGTEACARCHQSEHDAWAETPHATAYDTLQKFGMSESSDCLTCHTVGHGEYGGYGHRDATATLGGVQCESCHGPGSKHFDATRLASEIETKQLCVSCHDEENSPDFDFTSYMDKIRHW